MSGSYWLYLFVSQMSKKLWFRIWQVQTMAQKRIFRMIFFGGDDLSFLKQGVRYCSFNGTS